jgi:hypothetical protein
LIMPKLLLQSGAGPRGRESEMFPGRSPGGGNFYLTVSGSNSVAGAIVLWNGSARTTTLIDAQHLSVAIPAADIASPGNATLTVMNPGSGLSNGLAFTVQ